MKLENGIVHFTFDDNTGSIRQVKDLKTGKKYLQDPAGNRLVKIIAPTPDYYSRPLFSHEAGKPSFTKKGDTLTIKFPQLRDQGKTTGVLLTAKVRLPAGSPEAFFSLEIKNGGDVDVQETWFPWIGGRAWNRGDKHEQVVLSKLGNMNIADSLPDAAFRTHTFGRHNQHFGVGPISHLPMMDFSDAQGGLSYVMYSREPRLVYMAMDNFATDYSKVCFAWSFAMHPFLKPGGTWTSPEIGVGVHQQDWHTTADRLRAFTEQWWQKPSSPAGLKERIGLFHVQMRGFGGNYFHDFEEMPAMGSDCLKYGVSDMMIWEQTAELYLRADKGGFWEMPAARRNKLKQALAELRCMGVNTSACVNFCLATEYTRLWKKLKPLAMKSMFGELQNSSLPWSTDHAVKIDAMHERGGRPLCQGAHRFPEMTDVLLKQTMDLGFTSLLIDMAAPIVHCFSKRHGHSDPNDAVKRTYEWIQNTAQKVHALNQDGYAFGELSDLYNTQTLDFCWHWDWRSSFRGDIFRYVLPDMMLCWCIDENERDVLARAFALGSFLAISTRDMTGRLSDAPPLARQIARLAKLRRQTAPFVAHGRFLDTKGIEVEGGEAYTYVSDAGLAVTLANSEPKRQTLRIAVSTNALGVIPQSNGNVHVEGAKPRQALTKRRGDKLVTEITLPAYAAGVWTMPRS